MIAIQPPADVLGTQVDGVFALQDRSAPARRTHRFRPAGASESTDPPRSLRL